MNHMSKAKVYYQEGKVTGELELDSRIFGVKAKPALVHEVVVALQANARRPVAHSQTKGEVRGGGKKPWRQKGTGRARQGSIRSPQWKGGGVVFGPRGERNFQVKVNRQAKRQALFMALSDKLKDGRLLVLEAFTPSEPKTKHAAALFRKLPVTRRILAVVPKPDPALLRQVRNLPQVKLVTANSVGLLDVLGHQAVVFWKDALPVFESLHKNA